MRTPHCAAYRVEEHDHWSGHCSLRGHHCQGRVGVAAGGGCVQRRVLVHGFRQLGEFCRVLQLDRFNRLAQAAYTTRASAGPCRPQATMAVARTLHQLRAQVEPAVEAVVCCRVQDGVHKAHDGCLEKQQHGERMRRKHVGMSGPF